MHVRTLARMHVRTYVPHVHPLCKDSLSIYTCNKAGRDLFRSNRQNKDGQDRLKPCTATVVVVKTVSLVRIDVWEDILTLMSANAIILYSTYSLVSCL